MLAGEISEPVYVAARMTSSGACWRVEYLKRCVLASARSEAARFGVQVWDVKSWETPAIELLGHGAEIRAACFSQYGGCAPEPRSRNPEILRPENRNLKPARNLKPETRRKR